MATTVASLPALYSAIASFFSPGLYSVVLSQYKSYAFNWREFLRIELAEEAQIHAVSESSGVSSDESLGADKNVQHGIAATPTSQGVAREVRRREEGRELRSRKVAGYQGRARRQVFACTRQSG
jgi:urea-proton symporter